MYLSRLEIENFRGIRQARLEFGETTVLIGENDSGKSTLLDAISLVLSPRPENRLITFKYQDFFMEEGLNGFQPVGSLKIRVTFCERRPDEWSFMKNNDLGLVLPDDVNNLQELTLEVKADPVGEGGISEARWRLIIERRKPMDYNNDLAVLSWIRRINPVFRIKSGIIGDIADSDESSPGNGSEPGMPGEEAVRLEEKIRHYYHELN